MERPAPHTHRRRTFVLALSLGELSVAMFVLAVIFAFMVEVSNGETSTGPSEILIFATFLVFPVVGMLIAAKRPGNAVGVVRETVQPSYISLWLRKGGEPRPVRGRA